MGGWQTTFGALLLLADAADARKELPHLAGRVDVVVGAAALGPDRAGAACMHVAEAPTKHRSLDRPGSVPVGPANLQCAGARTRVPGQLWSPFSIVQKTTSPLLSHSL